jgi:hypothetical protein
MQAVVRGRGLHAPPSSTTITVASPNAIFTDHRFCMYQVFGCCSVLLHEAEGYLSVCYFSPRASLQFFIAWVSHISGQTTSLGLVFRHPCHSSLVRDLQTSSILLSFLRHSAHGSCHQAPIPCLVLHIICIWLSAVQFHTFHCCLAIPATLRLQKL